MLSSRAKCLTLVVIGISVSCGFIIPKAAFQGRISQRQSSRLFVNDPSRRELLSCVPSLAGLSVMVGGIRPAEAVERAIGGAEAKCRAKGNCLETFNIDGAVGWSWGGDTRCDASDPRCGPDGVLRDIRSDAVPSIPQGTAITHQVTLLMSVGKSEVGSLKLGLYGQATPKSVAQLLSFLSPLNFNNNGNNPGGLVTGNPLWLVPSNAATGATISQPVSMTVGGILAGIEPGQKLVFGLPSQAAAFAKARGLATPGSNFTPQPRSSERLSIEASVRPHDTAGLVSIPGDGLGYADTSKSDDETYGNAFQITSAAAPSMDKEGRKVIGQVLDEESMAFLARLGKLPTNKGLKGIIPGQNYGPPLLKCTLRNIIITPLAVETLSTETTTTSEGESSTSSPSEPKST